MAFNKDRAYDRAERYAAKAQYDRAAREYQTIIDNDPKDLRAWLLYADCLVRSGEPTAAITRYLQVAEYYVSERAHQKALAVFTQVLNLDPRRLDVHFKIAGLHLELGRVHDAIANYEQIAQVQLQASRVGEALKTYKIIADADPSVVSKRLRLAELYSRERMVDDAVLAFRQAGQVLIETDRLADYVRVAERLLYHRADDRPTMRELARVYLRLGDARRALMKLNALLQADQHDHVGLELLGETFMAMGKPDKATSVMLELVRGLLEVGETGRIEAVRVLDKGLTWDPSNVELRRVRQQIAPSGAPGPEPIDIDQSDLPLDIGDSDVLELGEDDVEADDAEALVDDEPAAERPTQSLTDSVLSDIAKSSARDGEPGDDFDKILFEARVYVKYRLFDHALDHVQGLLDKRPRHVGALSLRARALSELGRSTEAGEAYVEVARLVADQDPKLALEHLDAALAIDPGRAEARALRAQLTPGSASEPSRELVRPSAAESTSRGLTLDGPGDSGSFDLVDEVDSDDFAIDVSDEDSAVRDVGAGPDGVEFPVEDRFGLGDEATPVYQPTPAAGFLHEGVARASERELEAAEIREQVLDEPSTQIEDARTRGAEDEDDFSDFDADPDAFAGVDLDAAPAANHSPVRMARAGDVDEDPLPSETFERIPRSSVVEVRAREAWPDISDEIAEVRFFVEQGLDDDAEGALEDLRERYPGHPALAELERQKSETETALRSMQSGAEPLLDLVSEEDAEEDAYLSAIFSNDDAAAPRGRQAGIKARAADVAEADARTHFDLAMAYREMGLVDEALREFEAAGNDQVWRSRSLTLAATLRVHRGETKQAIADLQRAVVTAQTDDERCEARYELATVYQHIGDLGAAIELLESVPEGYRERDDRLGQLLAERGVPPTRR